jgi:DNA-binding MarR family transcriptional regulator
VTGYLRGMTGSASSEAVATDALVALSRTMTAVVARTLEQVDAVAVPQLRALVVVATRGPMNLTVLAAHLGVNASNASRTCEKLVAGGFLERSLPPRDRRNVVLRLTDRGERLVATLVESRRTALGEAVARMSATDQEQLVRALEALAEAMAAAHGSELVTDPDGRLIPWLL